MKPPKVPATYPCAVMCCSCNRIMGRDGKPLQFSVVQAAEAILEAGARTGGRKSLGVLPLEEVASFSNGDAADLFAAKHGWQITDSEGPNHRCPECLSNSTRLEETEERPARRGAYIPWPQRANAENSQPVETEERSANI